MAINVEVIQQVTQVDVVQDQTNVSVETAGVQGVPGASGAPLTNFSATPTWRAPRGQQNSVVGSNVNGQMHLAPFYLPSAVTLTGLACHVNGVGVTNAFVNTVIYSDNGSMYPLTLLAQSGAVSALSSGAKAGTFAGVALAAGVYWVGVNFTGTGTMPTTQIAQYGGEFWNTFDLGTGATPNYAQGNDGTTAGYANGIASPPSTFAGTIWTDSNAPKLPSWVALKVNR